MFCFYLKVLFQKLNFKLGIFGILVSLVYGLTIKCTAVIQVQIQVCGLITDSRLIAQF